jgi:hypothetical protein
MDDEALDSIISISLSLSSLLRNHLVGVNEGSLVIDFWTLPYLKSTNDSKDDDSGSSDSEG